MTRALTTLALASALFVAGCAMSYTRIPNFNNTTVNMRYDELISRVASYLHEAGIPVQTVDPNRGIIVASNSDFRPDQFANCALNAPQYLTKTQVEVTIFLTPQGPNRYSVFVAPIYSQTYVNLSNNKGRETKPCINTGLLERTLLRRLERH